MNHAMAQPVPAASPRAPTWASAIAGRLPALRLAGLLAFASLGAPAVAIAGDVGGGVAGPRFFLAPHGAAQVRAADIVLEADTVQVTWQVDRLAALPFTLGWTSDWIRWEGDANPAPARQRPTLTLRAGGHDLASTDAAEARAGTHDVSALLQAARLDPWLVATSPPVLPPQDPAADPDAVRALKAAGAIEHEANGDIDLANWSARRHVVFTVPVDAPDPVQARWQASPAFELVDASRLAAPARQAAACLSPRVAASLSAHAAAGTRYQVFDHEVPVAWDDASGGMPATTLAARSLPPGALVVACGGDGRAVRRAAGQPGVGVRPGPHGVLRFAVVVPVR